MPSKSWHTRCGSVLSAYHNVSSVCPEADDHGGAICATLRLMKLCIGEGAASRWIQLAFLLHFHFETGVPISNIPFKFFFVDL